LYYKRSGKKNKARNPGGAGKKQRNFVKKTMLQAMLASNIRTPFAAQAASCQGGKGLAESGFERSG
jgi:hypothetical protein